MRNLVNVDWAALSEEVKNARTNLSRVSVGIGRSYDYLTGKRIISAPLYAKDVIRIREVYGFKCPLVEESKAEEQLEIKEECGCGELCSQGKTEELKALIAKIARAVLKVVEGNEND